MSQHDYVIDNQTAPNFRADLNNALAAIVTLNGGGTAPSTTYGNMLWYDSSANVLKMRNEADDAWITLGTLDQVANTFQASYDLGFTPVQQGGGTSQFTNKVYIGWDGSNLRAQVDASDRGPISFHNQTLGIGQAWQSVSRASNTSYLNNTGRPIHVTYRAGSLPHSFQVSADNVNWLTVSDFQVSGAALIATHSIIVPNGWYYRSIGAAGTWTELR